MMTLPPRSVSSEFGPIGLVGLGLVGRGIAASLLSAGFSVIAVETSEQTRSEAYTAIQTGVKEVLDHTSPTPAASSWGVRYIATNAVNDCHSCAFVIESVPEDLALKKSVFAGLEDVVGKHVPIASNTSALPITLLQKDQRFPARFLGMHWAEPAYASRFLEIIRGEQTSDDAIHSAVTLGHALGKEPSIVQQDIPGFIANRLGYAIYREAAYLLEAGVGDVETIDRCFRNACGLWASLCGPFRWIDITGGPSLYAAAMAGVLPTLNNSSGLPPVFEEKQRNGERGTLNGRGFYTYESGDAQRWQSLLHEHAWEVRRLQNNYYPLAEGMDKK
jgi:3-hydroxybutyryl-CoA dehydrogenase